MMCYVSPENRIQETISIGKSETSFTYSIYAAYNYITCIRASDLLAFVQESWGKAHKPCRPYYDYSVVEDSRLLYPFSFLNARPNRGK